MKNIVLCFDRTRDQPGSRDATNARTMFCLLDDSDRQITWYHPGAGNVAATLSRRRAALHWRDSVSDEARATVAAAYGFLVDCWEPDDRIFLFGVGAGGYCAQALTRLLTTVGVLTQTGHNGPNLLDYALATYALPRTRRTEQDWRRVNRLAAQLTGRREIAVPVEFVGLWDTVRVPGLPRLSAGGPLSNIVVGRHAVAIDGGPFGERLVASEPERIEEVWFRGAHCDIAGGRGACLPLTDIALDWVLDGAINAGALIRPELRDTRPTPGDVDALAGSPPTISFRRPPPDALLHSSVDIYLRAHPQYWRRLPAHVVWADVDWLARGERLVPTAKPVPAQPAYLVAAAS